MIDSKNGCVVPNEEYQRYLAWKASSQPTHDHLNDGKGISPASPSVSVLSTKPYASSRVTSSKASRRVPSDDDDDDDDIHHDRMRHRRRVRPRTPDGSGARSKPVVAPTSPPSPQSSQSSVDHHTHVNLSFYSFIQC